jgi:hypothetical protein
MVNNCGEISRKCIFVDVFPYKVILGCNHDFGSGAACYKAKWIPKINLDKITRI